MADAHRTKEQQLTVLGAFREGALNALRTFWSVLKD